MKEQFLELLRQVKREGIEDLIKFLEKSDFFKAPASTRFHGDHEGGLVEHSMKVYEILKRKSRKLYRKNRDSRRKHHNNRTFA